MFKMCVGQSFSKLGNSGMWNLAHVFKPRFLVHSVLESYQHLSVSAQNRLIRSGLGNSWPLGVCATNLPPRSKAVGRYWVSLAEMSFVSCKALHKCGVLMQNLKVKSRKAGLFRKNAIKGAAWESISDGKTQCCTEFIGRINKNDICFAISIWVGSFGTKPCTMVSKLVALTRLVLHINRGEPSEKTLWHFSNKGRTSSCRNLPLKVRKLTIRKISPCTVASWVHYSQCFVSFVSFCLDEDSHSSV